MIGGFPIAYGPIAGLSLPTEGGVVNWFTGESATNAVSIADTCNAFSTDKSGNDFTLDQSSNSIELTV